MAFAGMLALLTALFVGGIACFYKFRQWLFPLTNAQVREPVVAFLLTHYWSPHSMGTPFADFHLLGTEQELDGQYRLFIYYLIEGYYREGAAVRMGTGSAGHGILLGTLDGDKGIITGDIPMSMGEEHGDNLNWYFPPEWRVLDRQVASDLERRVMRAAAAHFNGPEETIR